MKVIRLIVSPYKLLIYAFLLVLLSIFDTIFTDFGIRNGLIEEANPLMDFVYHKSVYVFYIVKISLPFFLLLLFNRIKPKLYFCLLMKSALMLYFFVLFTHIYWMFIIFKEYHALIWAQVLRLNILIFLNIATDLN